MLDVYQTNYYIRQAKDGDAAAKEILLENNKNLIKSIVRRYLNKGVEYDDLFQLASIGLLKAINGYNEQFGVRFSTYAVPMIAGEIKRFMRDDGSIKVSRAIKAEARAINGYIEEYTLKFGVQPSLKQIAQKFAMAESQVVFTMGSTRMPISIYTKADSADDKSQLLLDKIPQEDGQEDMLDLMELRTAIAQLDERERKIIMLRYFKDLTQSQVAKLLGVSQVQISRIENKVLTTIKSRLMSS
jgi:RNA polymerase sporulation-specific sigma factor